MPAPLAIPPIQTCLPFSSNRTAQVFSRVSVVIIARGAKRSLRLKPEIKAGKLLISLLIGILSPITPVEAIKGINAASEWVSSSSDLCEPYAVDMLLKHCVPCGTDQDEDILLPDFRWESLDYDLGAATISVSGQCNVSNATVTRSDDAECA